MSKTAIKTFSLEADGSHTPFGSAREYYQGLLDQQHTVSKSTRSKKSSTGKIRWIPKGESVSVAGRKIGGMIYVTDCNREDLSYEEDICACINTNMAVAKRRKKYKESENYYYEHYCYVSETVRAIYLDWLESGRKSENYRGECIMLYFGGLERRFFYDDPDLNEKKEILAEIERLLSIYGQDEGIEYSLRTFRDFATTLTYPNEVTPLIDKENTKFPLSLALGLGRLVMRKEHINADWALSWYLCTPELRKSITVYRCWQEFVVLFRQVFKEKYPRGLYVRSQGLDVIVDYHSFSPDDFFKQFIFKNSNGKTVPDIVSLSKPIKQLQEVASETNKLLKKFNSYLLHTPNGRENANVLALLPKSLWSDCFSKELDRIKEWASVLVEWENGFVGISDFMSNTAGSYYGKPTQPQFKLAADMLAQVGFGVVQDPRFALVKSPFTGLVKIFPMKATNDLESQHSPVFKSASLALALGIKVLNDIYMPAYTGRQIPTHDLKKFIDTAEGLNPNDKVRLLANLPVYTNALPRTPQLLKRLEGASDETKSLIRQLVVTIAVKEYASGHDRLHGIEEVYVKMGFKRELVSKDIIDRKNKIREENTKQLESTRNAKVRKAVTLDKKKIDELVVETKLVKKVLGKVFEGTTDGAANKKTKKRSSEVLEVFTGLDKSCIPLTVELLAKEQWSYECVSRLAREHKLMWDGSLEAINEWAHEQFEGELIEEYDGYRPNVATVKKLRQKCRLYQGSSSLANST